MEVKILRVDLEERKIGLSLKRAQWTAEAPVDASRDKPKPAATGGLGGGMDTHGSLGTDKHHVRLWRLEAGLKLHGRSGGFSPRELTG